MLSSLWGQGSHGVPRAQYEGQEEEGQKVPPASAREASWRRQLGLGNEGEAGQRIRGASKTRGKEDWHQLLEDLTSCSRWRGPNIFSSSRTQSSCPHLGLCAHCGLLWAGPLFRPTMNSYSSFKAQQKWHLMCLPI